MNPFESINANNKIFSIVTPSGDLHHVPSECKHGHGLFPVPNHLFSAKFLLKSKP